MCIRDRLTECEYWRKYSVQVPLRHSWPELYESMALVPLLRDRSPQPLVQWAILRNELGFFLGFANIRTQQDYTIIVLEPLAVLVLLAATSATDRG